MFRKRKNVDVAKDEFTFQLNKTYEVEKNGDTIIKTIRPMVKNSEVEFESVSPMPSVTDCLKAGIALKEVPTDGILDSPDNLDYNAEDADEKILARVEKIAEKASKKLKSDKKD